MADEIHDATAPSSETSSIDEDRVSVASNWKLVWWRFRKNRLAVASAIVLLIFYAVVLVPDFFSNQDPEATDAFLAFIPVQGISFFDKTGFNPSVPDVVGKRNSVTLRMQWVPDETVRIPIALFVRGYKYKVLGLFETDIHLIDAKDPKSKGRPHFLGTDRLGRDQWSRMMFGTRTSMTVGLVAVALSMILGVFLWCRSAGGRRAPAAPGPRGTARRRPRPGAGPGCAVPERGRQPRPGTAGCARRRRRSTAAHPARQPGSPGRTWSSGTAGGNWPP